MKTGFVDQLPKLIVGRRQQGRNVFGYGQSASHSCSINVVPPSSAYRADDLEREGPKAIALVEAEKGKARR